MMTHFRPESGLVIRPETIMFTLVFFAVCIASSLEGLAPTLGQWLPPVANAAHTAGLVAGIAWGLWDARRRS